MSDSQNLETKSEFRPFRIKDIEDVLKRFSDKWLEKMPQDPTEGQTWWDGRVQYRWDGSKWGMVMGCTVCNDLALLRWMNRPGHDYNTYPDAPVVKCFCKEGDRRAGASVLAVREMNPDAKIYLYDEDKEADLGEIGKLAANTTSHDQYY